MINEIRKKGNEGCWAALGRFDVVLKNGKGKQKLADEGGKQKSEDEVQSQSIKYSTREKNPAGYFLHVEKRVWRICGRHDGIDQSTASPSPSVVKTMRQGTIAAANTRG